MLDQIDDLNKKMDEIEDEGSEYDDESDPDLDSELGDAFDGDAVKPKGKGSAAESGDEEDDRGGNQTAVKSNDMEGSEEEFDSSAMVNSNAKINSGTALGTINSGISPSGTGLGNESKFGKMGVNKQGSVEEIGDNEDFKDLSPAPRTNRQQSMIDQSQSDMNSSAHKSRRRSKKFRMRKGDESSNVDSMSRASGMMFRTTKKRSVRRGGKRSISLAIQNEAIITKI